MPPVADLLLDFDDVETSTGTVAPMMPAAPMLQPSSETSPKLTAPAAVVLHMSPAPAQYYPTTSAELINRMTGQGLRVTYRFMRRANLYSEKMTSVELGFVNEGTEPIELIKLAENKLQFGMSVSPMAPVESLAPSQTRSAVIGIDFADTTQQVPVEIIVGDKSVKSMLGAPVGEQLTPVTMSKSTFDVLQARLRGMNETSGSFTLRPGLSMDAPGPLCQALYKAANVVRIDGGEGDTMSLAGRTQSAQAPVLLSLARHHGKADEVKLTVNCEKMVVGSMLFKELKAALSS